MVLKNKQNTQWQLFSCHFCCKLQLTEIFGVSVDQLMQVKTQKPQDNKAEKIIDIILKAVPLAMGVAVAVSAIMKTLDMYSGFAMLGIGMVCIGVNGLNKND